MGPIFWGGSKLMQMFYQLVKILKMVDDWFLVHPECPKPDPRLTWNLKKHVPDCGKDMHVNVTNYRLPLCWKFHVSFQIDIETCLFVSVLETHTNMEIHKALICLAQGDRIGLASHARRISTKKSRLRLWRTEPLRFNQQGWLWPVIFQEIQGITTEKLPNN